MATPPEWAPTRPDTRDADAKELRAKALLDAMSAHALQTMTPPGMDQEQSHKASLQLALTSIALSLAADAMERHGY